MDTQRDLAGQYLLAGLQNILLVEKITESPAGRAAMLRLLPLSFRAWLSVLEATYQVIILRPYHANIGKRMVKTPKVYFTDVGTLCHLAGLKDPPHAAQGPMGVPLMERAALSEISKALTHRGVDPRLHLRRQRR